MSDDDKIDKEFTDSDKNGVKTKSIPANLKLRSISSENEEEPFVHPKSYFSISPTTSTKSADTDIENDKELVVELYDLNWDDSRPDNVEWTETARWLNFEENVQGVDNHWGRKHVSFLSLNPLIQLRQCIARGLALLDVSTNTFSELCELIVTTLAKEYNVDKTKIQSLISSFHKREKKPVEQQSAIGYVARRLSNFALEKTHSQTKLDQHAQLPTAAPASSVNRQSAKPTQAGQIRPGKRASVDSSRLIRQLSQRTASSLLRRTSSFDLERAIEKAKLTGSIESAQILSGVITEMKHLRCIIVRLNEAKVFPDLDTMSGTPVKFIIMTVGPNVDNFNYHEMGRAVATFFANSRFLPAFYAARNRQDFIIALDDFIEQSVVVPPCDVERKPAVQTVEELIKALKSRRKRKNLFHFEPKETTVLKEAPLDRKKVTFKLSSTVRPPAVVNNLDDPLSRSGKLFGGLVRDFNRRFSNYKSDFKDGINTQCVGTVLFMFFAVLAPAVTFGGLLGEKTHGWMGTTEVLIAQSVCGIIWALFSAQPLMIIGATGPLLVFEKSLFDFCEGQSLEFVVFRVWIGFWILSIALITVAFEGSFLIGYVTKFTEDIFSTLIAFIFIFESLKFMFKNFDCHYLRDLNSYCTYSRFHVYNQTSNGSEDNVHFNESSENRNFTYTETYVNNKDAKYNVCNQPDTALLSTILVLLTFVLAYSLRQIRTSDYLGRTLRRIVGDFAVPIALIISVVFNFILFSDTYLQHLNMANTFGPTRPSDRGWLINPFGLKISFPIWAIFAALVPAILVYILIFVEVEITELVLNRKDRGLRKGCGFHWDLLLIGILTFLCSLFGLPWMCAAIMQSLANCNSLTVWKKRVIGKPMQIERVCEQRITAIGVSLLTGICAFLGFILQKIPIAVLFGVFMFLGIMNLTGVDLLSRFVLMFLPQKYFPDKPYCQKVGMWRMHLYTIMQIFLLAIVWAFKSFTYTALAFPFVLLLICLIRIFLLPKIFSSIEMEALDGHEDHDDIEDMEELDSLCDHRLPM